MFFFTLSNVDIQFTEKKLTWRSYTIAKFLSTTKWVELINKKKFAKIALDKDFKTFMVYVLTLETLLARIKIHFLKEAQVAFLK